MTANRLSGDSRPTAWAKRSNQLVRVTRSIVDIEWGDATRSVYPVQFGRGSLATIFGAYFDDETSAKLSSEELFGLTKVRTGSGLAEEQFCVVTAVGTVGTARMRKKR